ncbi:thioesterase II family protein [Streptomyces monashensis]|uniref:Thioesterase n=1 Tax=Streptomyces monashensis TaxID=1678012 RepID=A0A1S2QKU3_9ACTN|nr:alpha/beta fold hydrolase [Streptomyces monashensis]OIK06005.1 thioesterase [Streptomyces monashensis]
MAGYRPPTDRTIDGDAMELRLFVFHHAGGSHLLYRDWPDALPADWDVHLIDAPGHGMLADQPAIGDAPALVDHFLRDLDDRLTGRFALFGHSMGGLIAYELTRRLLAEGRTPPLWLGLSSRGTPLPDGARTHRHLLGDEELRREVAALGGTPSAVLEDPALWRLYAPVIRRDMQLVETWRPAPDAGLLSVPLSVFGGRHDTATPPARIDGWAGRAARFLGLHLFDGGHFYFRPDPGPLLRQVTVDARRALDLAAGLPGHTVTR